MGKVTLAALVTPPWSPHWVVASPPEEVPVLQLTCTCHYATNMKYKLYIYCTIITKCLTYLYIYTPPSNTHPKCVLHCKLQSFCDILGSSFWVICLRPFFKGLFGTVSGGWYHMYVCMYECMYIYMVPPQERPLCMVHCNCQCVILGPVCT